MEAMVLQDALLVSGTLAGNLRYIQREATDEKVARLAEAALVSEVAEDLPDRLDTQIAAGEIGLTGSANGPGFSVALLVECPPLMPDELAAGP